MSVYMYLYLFVSVHMYAPELTILTVNARSASLKWEWTEQCYNNLSVTCQVYISYGGIYTMVSIARRQTWTRFITFNLIPDILLLCSQIGKVGVGLQLAVNDLIPDWKYSAAVRCGTTQHFWKWSEWSKTVSFNTEGDGNKKALYNTVHDGC